MLNRTSLVVLLAFLSQSFVYGGEPSPERYKGLQVNGEAPVLVDLLKQANETIDIEIYEMGDLEVRAALRDALMRKVRIRVVKEPKPIGAKCDEMSPPNERDNADCADKKLLVDQILKGGGTYVPFNKEQLCAEGTAKQCFEHGKLVIIDEKIALVSSGNFNSSNLCTESADPSKCNRDYSYVIRRRRFVRALLRVFEMDILSTRYDLIETLRPGPAKRITVSPLSLQPLIDFIKSAKKSIRIENQYLKDADLNQAIIDQAKAGVHVEVSLASLCAFSKPKANDRKKAQELFGAFDEAGIQVRMFTNSIKVEGRPGYMHAKAIVVDDRRAWMGSVNGSTNALSRNREFGFFFKDRKSVKKLVQTMDEDFRDPGAETWQESLECLKDRKASDLDQEE